MTYGDIKFRLTKAFPGVDLDLIEGWINDRYTEILGELPWQRQDVESVLITVAPYSTGTVALTQGSTAVTLTDGTWTSAMNGRAFRTPPRSEFYQFTYSSSTTGILDRPYEGPTATASGYSIFQHIYPLPSDCRLLEDDAFDGKFGPLKRFTHAQLNSSDPWREATGVTQGWASYMDDSSTPPLMQVEIYPVPDSAVGIPFTYAAQDGPLTATSTLLKVWLQPTALIEGVTAKIKAHLRDYNGAQLHMASAIGAVKIMRNTEAQGMAPASLTLDSYYTAHRRSRCR